MSDVYISFMFCMLCFFSLSKTKMHFLFFSYVYPKIPYNKIKLYSDPCGDDCGHSYCEGRTTGTTQAIVLQDQEDGEDGCSSSRLGGATLSGDGTA